MNNKIKMKSLFLIILLGIGIFGLASQAKAANCGAGYNPTCNCGDTVKGNYTLAANLSCPSSSGLIVGASGITIDGNSYTITGSGSMGGNFNGIDNSFGGYNNITIKNFSNITSFPTGIYFYNSTGGIIQDNTITSNLTYGIYVDSSSPSSNTLTGNTVNLNYYGILLYSSSSNTLTSNTVNFNRYGIYLHSSSNTLTSNTVNSNSLYGIYVDSSSSSNTLTSNTISENVKDIYNNGTNTYSQNQIIHNINSQMLTFTEVTRTKNLNNTISFDISMFNAAGASCSSCTYTVTTSPSETVTSNKVGNNITGSFTATKYGVYSLIFTITDSNNNATTRNYLFFINAAGSATTKYYLRSVLPTHGQSAAADSKSLLLTAPTSTESWTCSSWVQNSPDNLPNYPLAFLLSIDSYSWYKTSVGGFIGIERFVTPTQAVDFSSVVTAAANYTWVNKSFASLDWAMDYTHSWYWLSLKLDGGSSYWQTTVAQPSYANFSYSYTTTPAVKSNSNTDIIILSATSSGTANNDAVIVLKNPTSLVASTTLTLDFQHPFLGSFASTISADGTTAITPSVSAGATVTLSGTAMNIVPSSGSVDVAINTWNTSGTYSKQWTETGSGVASASHVIGNFVAGKYYTVSVDNVAYGTYLADANGQITFTYSGGYSSHTFNADEDTTAPTNVEISSITADSTSQLTVTAQTATDAGSGLHATPYYFDRNNGAANSGWQTSTTFVDTGLSPGTQYTYKVKARDAAGNESAYSSSVSKSTISGGGGLPAVAYMPPAVPAQGFSILINNGAKETQSKTVALTLKGGSDTNNMAISNDPDFTNAVQESYSQTKSWTLTEGEGQKTVYVKFYTQWGQSSEIVQDAIFYTNSPSQILPQQNLGGQAMTPQQRATLIAQIKQQLISLITQLIQMLTLQISQMQK